MEKREGIWCILSYEWCQNRDNCVWAQLRCGEWLLYPQSIEHIVSWTKCKTLLICLAIFQLCHAHVKEDTWLSPALPICTSAAHIFCVCNYVYIASWGLHFLSGVWPPLAHLFFVVVSVSWPPLSVRPSLPSCMVYLTSSVCLNHFKITFIDWLHVHKMRLCFRDHGIVQQRFARSSPSSEFFACIGPFSFLRYWDSLI